MNSIIGPILYEGVRVRGEHAWCEVNQHLMTVISCLPRGNGTILRRESAHEEAHQSLYAEGRPCEQRLNQTGAMAVRPKTYMSLLKNLVNGKRYF